ncbi:MAG TPA: SCO family protein [Vicinamibacterales bacterium]|nr:SCO family protein [Vicinamibacterales bacterium]
MRRLGLVVRRLICAAIAVGVAGASLEAQGIAGQGGVAPDATAASARPAILQGITIEQKLNTRIPLGLHFRDESGKDVVLRQYFTDRPVILNLVYYNCAMLCPQVVEGLTRSLKKLTFEVGKQYDVLTVSFDPRDTPAASAVKRKMALAKLGQVHAAAGWHFLTGDQQSIRRLTDAVGFVYRWDPRTQQFYHAAGIMILTPDGRLSRYFYGIDFAPTDLRFGLVQASGDRIGTVVDAVLLFCCRYDATAGKYNWLVGRLLGIAGALTVLILGSLLFLMARGGPREHHAA